MAPHGPTRTPDEAFEARAVFRLMLRGCVLAAASGLAWHLPTGSGALGTVAAIVSLALACAACLPLIVAAATLRNQLVRLCDLHRRKRLAVAAGVAILAGLLLLAVAIFRGARHLYAVA